MENDLNPYAPPQAECPVVTAADAINIRRHLLGTESALKGLGVVFVAGGALVCANAYVKLNVSLEMLAKLDPWQMADRLLAGVLTIACGLGLERLKRWAWIGCIILCVFYMALAMSGLVSHWVISLLVYGIVLQVLLNFRARHVMAGQYREIMGLTPGLKSRVPVWAFCLAGVFLAGVMWVTFQSGRF